MDGSSTPRRSCCCNTQRCILSARCTLSFSPCGRRWREAPDEGSFSTCETIRSDRNPSPVSPLRGEPPSPTRGEGKRALPAGSAILSCATPLPVEQRQNYL